MSALNNASPFFSRGFRPFFLLGALHAALMVALWVPFYLGVIHVPTAFPPLSWHQHELLFGYVPAIIAGFLLTAVTNWTGRPAVSGLPLLLLAALWLAGRITVAASGIIGLKVAAFVALLFLPVLALVLLRDLLASGNRRNYKITAIIGLLWIAQIIFVLELSGSGDMALPNRLAVAVVVMLIAVIGGRIVPSFTGNWLRMRGEKRMPAPFGALDKAAMILMTSAFALWVVASWQGLAVPAGAVLIAAGLVQAVRQMRWRPFLTFPEPLLAILHIAGFFLPLGFLLTGVGLIAGEAGWQSAGLHAWTAGAIGAMTLGVMTRVTRGHTGSPLHAPPSTVALIYAPVLLSAFFRMFAALLPAIAGPLLSLAAVLWVVAFLGFVALHAGMAMRREG